MTIDDNLLEKLEILSAIKVDKKDEFKKDLENILNFVKNLDELDLENFTPNGGDKKTPLRDDIPVSDDSLKIILKNAPSKDGSFFVVPKIIE